MAFSQLSDTEYPALCVMGNRTLLSCFHTPTRNILLSESEEGLDWRQPWPVLDGATDSKLPSLAANKETLRLAFCRDGQEGIWISDSKNGKSWSEPRRIFSLSGERLTRPKISLDSTGATWLTCHSEHWGAFRDSYDVRTSVNVLKINISSQGGAGRSIWTLNACQITNEHGQVVKTIFFGPSSANDPLDSVRLTAEDSLYDSRKACGFDGAIEEILRQSGDEITRRMVYCDRARILQIDLPAGRYKVQLTHSSWVASKPSLKVDFDSEWSVEEIHRPGDVCFVLREDKDGNFQPVTKIEYASDANRPAAVCENTAKRYFSAWTSFSGDAVQIVGKEIELS